MGGAVPVEYIVFKFVKYLRCFLFQFNFSFWKDGSTHTHMHIIRHIAKN
jgi:hypothetical protein